MCSLRHCSYNLCPSLCSSGKSHIAVQIHHKAVTSSTCRTCPQSCSKVPGGEGAGWGGATLTAVVNFNVQRKHFIVSNIRLGSFWCGRFGLLAVWEGAGDQDNGETSLSHRPPPTPHMSRLKARMRRSRSPIFAAWKSSGWSIMDRAILRAAQMFPDITWWDSW